MSLLKRTYLCQPQVLQAVQESSADALEDRILACPAGMQVLVEVLRDSREEVRNQVILLLGQVIKRPPLPCGGEYVWRGLVTASNDEAPLGFGCVEGASCFHDPTREAREPASREPLVLVIPWRRR